MAGRRREERRGVSLTRGSLILIGVAVLWAGGAAGFGIGYKLEQNHTKSAAKTAKAKPKAKTKTATAQLQRLQKERTCLASQGLHWPKLAGKFATQVRTPPPGVDAAKYRKALVACYAAAAAKAGRAPPATGAAAVTG